MLVTSSGHTRVLTGVRARDEPQTAILLCGIFQGNPEAQDPAQRLRVQEGGILVWCHCKDRLSLGSLVGSSSSGRTSELLLPDSEPSPAHPPITHIKSYIKIPPFSLLQM